LIILQTNLVPGVDLSWGAISWTAILDSLLQAGWPRRKSGRRNLGCPTCRGLHVGLRANRTARNSFNPRALIYHLTNGNGCANLLPEVVDSVPVWSLLPSATPSAPSQRSISCSFVFILLQIPFPQLLSFYICTKPTGVWACTLPIFNSVSLYLYGKFHVL
jgi:hypothetical protein